MTNHIMDEISTLPLFSGLSKVQQARMLPLLDKNIFPRGDTICNQGDKAEMIYLVNKGSAELIQEDRNGHSVVVSTLTKNVFYGAIEILEETTFSSSMIAAEKTEIISLSHSGLYKLLHYRPELVRLFLKNQKDIYKISVDTFSKEHYQHSLSIKGIWKRLDKRDQKFISSTLLLNKVGLRSSAAVSGMKDFKEILSRLIKYRDVLVRGESENTWVYTEALKCYLLQNRIIPDDQIKKQHERIAKYAEKRKNWELALDHTLAAKNFETGKTYLEKLLESGWNDSEKLYGYKSQFPEKYHDIIKVHIQKEKQKEADEVIKETFYERFRIGLKMNFGWLLCLLLPVFTYFLAESQNFSWDRKIFLCIISSAVIMWMFKLVADYIVSIFIVIACLTLKTVPANIILKGFTSGTFFLAMSVFGLGAVLVNSGLLYRVSLMILYRFPSTLFWQNLALAIVGTAITPVVPSANGRLALVSPIVMDMNETMGYKPRSNAGVRLSMTAMSSFGMMSNFFLTGKSINFVLLGLLTINLQNRFTFLYWMIAAAVAGLVTFIGNFFLASRLYKEESPPKISKAQIKNQLSIMGKLDFAEWIALLSCGIFILGVSTATLHRISTPWVGVMVLFIVLFVGELGKKEFKKEIDWPFLLFLAGLIGFVNAFSYLRLDAWLGSHMGFLSFFMTENFFVFILILSAIILLVRLVLPAIASAALFMAFLIPVAAINGINPWVVGLCVLIMCNGWFFPYQSTFYLTFYNTTKGKMFTNSQAAPYAIWMNLINLLALLLSVPYWKALGLLK